MEVGFWISTSGNHQVPVKPTDLVAEPPYYRTTAIAAIMKTSATSGSTFSRLALLIARLGLAWLLVLSVLVPARGANTFENTNSLIGARSGHSATLLPDGKVLVAGGFIGSALASSEIYDPATGHWSAAGVLPAARSSHTATLLLNGKVLVAGGSSGGALASAALYDPATGAWTPTGSLATGRYSHTATLLADGRVLVAGGSVGPLSSSEVYDPSTGLWNVTPGSLATAREAHTATLLPNGKVLVAGGSTGSTRFDSAELYDPATGFWSATDSLGTARTTHTATLLPNGKVLATGGTTTGAVHLTATELYDPALGTWSGTGALSTARRFHTATLLPNGRLLVAGGLTTSGGYVATAELYDSASGAWSAAGPLSTARYSHTATLLPDGRALIAGGYNGSYLAGAQLYTPTRSLGLFGSFDSIRRTANGRMELSVAKPAGFGYLVHASTNLTQWRLTDCFFASENPAHFVDPESALIEKRFYLHQTFPASLQPLFQFPSAGPTGDVMFRKPSFSSTTADFLDLALSGAPDFAQVTTTFPVGSAATGVLHVSWSFNGFSNQPWLRLTTSGAFIFGNPIIDFNEGICFEFYSDRDLYLALGLRETTVNGAVGGSGGTTGPIEWVGGTVNNSVSPPRGRLITAGQWHRVCFFMPAEPARGFTGDGALAPVSGNLGVLEHLAIVPVTSLGVFNIYLGDFHTFKMNP
jgi:hypothetical protein